MKVIYYILLLYQYDILQLHISMIYYSYILLRIKSNLIILATNIKLLFYIHAKLLFY